MGGGTDGAGVGVARGLEELRQPYGGVDGQGLALERFDGYPMTDGEKEPPQALDAHGWR